MCPCSTPQLIVLVEDLISVLAALGSCVVIGGSHLQRGHHMVVRDLADLVQQLLRNVALPLHHLLLHHLSPFQLAPDRRQMWRYPLDYDYTKNSG
ncbi:hypothetical protein MRX96_043698 [Rhipicephalus microplus]